MAINKNSFKHSQSLAVPSLVSTGMFDPVLLDDALDPNNGQVYTEAIGRYVIIAGLITFSVNMALSSLGSLNIGHVAKIGGLPYIVGVGPAAQAISGYAENLAADDDASVSARCVQGSTHFELRTWSDASGIQPFLIFSLKQNSVLQFSGAYPQ